MMDSEVSKGLYRKFEVSRTDGSSAPGGKHHGCEYFVLDLTHDTHAPAALRAYADSCEADYPQLAADLRMKAGPALAQPSAGAEAVVGHVRGIAMQGGGTYAAIEWSGESLPYGTPLYTARPDARDALKALYKAYVQLLEAGRDRIVSLGGDCIPVDDMERSDPHLIQARRTIAALAGPQS